MAKKQTGLEDLFKKTTQEQRGQPDTHDLDRGKIQATGVGLREGELTALESIAAELAGGPNEPRISRNALMRWAIRWFIIQYRAGNIDLSGFVVEPPPPKKSLRLPGQE